MKRAANLLKGRLKGREGKALRVLGIVVASLLGAVAGNLIVGEAAELLATSVALMLAVLIAVMMIGVALILRVLSILNELRVRQRFSINYYPGMFEHELLELHRQAAKVVREAPAGAEIYAVNSYVEVFSDPPAPRVQQAQREYLKEFEDRFKTVPYHRLIQLRNGQMRTAKEPLSHLITPAYLDHYRRIVSYALDYPNHPVKIEEVEARLPISFVLVKSGNGGRIVWQMNEHAPSGGQPDALKIHGIFIINDPDGLIVEYFLEWFRLLDRGHARPLAMSDLDDVVSTPAM